MGFNDMKSTWTFVIQAFSALALCISVSSCDVDYSPLFCNGFSDTVYVTAVWKGGNKSGTAIINSSECKALDVISTEQQDIADEFRATEGYVGIIRVSSVSSELIGRYLVPSHMALRGLGRHSSHWLLSREGLFHIARELESNWENNIEAIQKQTTADLQNSIR